VVNTWFNSLARDVARVVLNESRVIAVFHCHCRWPGLSHDACARRST
jgi:hypothetical protein